MLLHSEQIHTKLQVKLNEINNSQIGKLNQIEFCSSACEDAISELKDLVNRLGFRNLDEEIYFFKKMKPMISSKLYYYILLYDLERKRVYSGREAQIEYLQNTLKKIDLFFIENIEFCTYYRTDSNILDDKYFVRSQLSLNLAYSDKFFTYDKGFSTNRDTHIAHIMAKDLLMLHVAGELEKLRNQVNHTNAGVQSHLRWTDTKVSLTLLVYALHSSAVFNGGNVELKEIAQTLGKVCNIDLGDIYRTWSEIKLKKDPSKFLETLKLAVDNRIIADLQ